jgi:predicted RNase H-like nuclease (RuvC/YqgF family)
MNDLETLEIRLAAALNRVSSHIENPIKQNDNFELERIERLERRILILTDQLEAQENENIRLTNTIAELVKSNQIIQSDDTKETNVLLEQNNRLRIELENLQSIRERDLAEIDDILREINPILERDVN